MDMSMLLGLPLSRAQELLAQAGLSPQITFTSDPRHPRDEGTIRVLRATEQELIVARVRDAVPEA